MSALVVTLVSSTFSSPSPTRLAGPPPTLGGLVGAATTGFGPSVMANSVSRDAELPVFASVTTIHYYIYLASHARTYTKRSWEII